MQGEAAAGQIAAAIDLLDAHGEADLIIVARGGGSVEELWAFNEEEVARAIYRLRLPVIAGVGHETDFSYCRSGGRLSRLDANCGGSSGGARRGRVAAHGG